MGADTQVSGLDWYKGTFSMKKEATMKIWTKPQIREQEVGLEVTSYLSAEIGII